MRGKKIWLMSLISMLIVSMAMIGVTTAVPPVRVSLNPPSTTGLRPGDVFDIIVNIENVVPSRGVSAWEIKMSWDSYVIEIQEPPTQGTFLSDAGPTYFVYKVSLFRDSVTMGCILKVHATASGDGWLATVTFKAIRAGTSKVDVAAKLLDDELVEIDHEEVGAGVGVHRVIEVTGTWEEAQRFDPTAEMEAGRDACNTLYAKVTSCHPDPVYVYVDFMGFDDVGTPLGTLRSDTVLLPAHEIEVFSADFCVDPPTFGLGKYRYLARAYFSYDGETWYQGGKEKTLKFEVIGSIHDVAIEVSDLTWITTTVQLNLYLNTPFPCMEWDPDLEYYAFLYQMVFVDLYNDGTETETVDITLSATGVGTVLSLTDIEIEGGGYFGTEFLLSLETGGPPWPSLPDGSYIFTGTVSEVPLEVATGDNTFVDPDEITIYYIP